MDCSRCGTPATPGDRVCRVCGAPLAQAAVEATPADAPFTKPSAMPSGAFPPAEPVVAPPTQKAIAAIPPQGAASQPTAPAAAPSPATYGGAYGSNGSNSGYVANPGYSNYPNYPNYSPYPGYSTYPGYPAQQAYQYPPAYYGYYYAYPYAQVKPPRPKGETYRQVLGWIVTIGSALGVVIGLLLLLILLVSGATPIGSGLNGLSEIAGLAVAGLGCGAGVYFGITAILRRPSVRFSLPPFWLWLALTVGALTAGVVLWHVVPTPGGTFGALPLVLLAGALPALTILAYGGWLLRFPSTWRHTMLSLLHGATLAIVLALILELVGSFVIFLIFQLLGLNGNFALTSLGNANPSNLTEVIILFLILSVVAPLVEEGVKPLGAILVMSRVRGPAEAFFLGLAAGVGFDFVETVGYFGMGQADWVAVAIERIGAGLLHGVGAGMAALGWYYLLRGKGVSHRWLRGFGGIAYAVIQHGIFNGSNLLALVPGPIGKFMSQSLYLDRLPLGQGTGLFFALYVIILGVLTYVGLRLRRAEQTAPPTTTVPGGTASGGGTPTPYPTPYPAPTPEPVAGGAR